MTGIQPSHCSTIIFAPVVQPYDPQFLSANKPTAIHDAIPIIVTNTTSINHTLQIQTSSASIPIRIPAASTYNVPQVLFDANNAPVSLLASGALTVVCNVQSTQQLDQEPTDAAVVTEKAAEPKKRKAADVQPKETQPEKSAAPATKKAKQQKEETKKSVSTVTAEEAAAAAQVAEAKAQEIKQKLHQVTKLPNGLQFQDETIGTGTRAQKGQTVAIRYRGMFTTGSVFDSNMPKGQLLVFTIGRGEVIRGMEQGLIDMQIGGKRRLVIPPALAYGAEGSGPIGPNSTLIFDVELVKIHGAKK